MNNILMPNIIQWALILIPMIVAGIIQLSLKHTTEKYSKVYAKRGLTGAEVAQMMLQQKGIADVSVVPIEGILTDHFDPRTKVISLSKGVYYSRSITAVGVAAHETGHAIQHAEGYVPIKVRGALVPITNIGTKLAMPIIIVGMIFSLPMLIDIGVWGYALLALFQFVTLPCEFNASSRALNILKTSYYLDDEEVVEARKVLTAAALTYVAAFFATAMTLARLMLLRGNRRD